MAITLRLPASGSLGHVGFAYSPALEATLSLRSVLNPKRYPMYLPWTRRTRGLSPELRAKIQALAFTFQDNVLGAFEIGLSGDFPTFVDEMAGIATCDQDRVVYELTEPFRDPYRQDLSSPTVVHDRAFQAAVLENARSTDPTAAKILEDAFGDPLAVRERIVGMLQRYWDEAFHEELDRIQPRFDAEVSSMARALIIGGMTELVEQFLPEVSYNQQDHSLIVDRPYDQEIDVAERGGLAFVPYVFDFRIMVEMDPPWNLSIFLRIRAMRQPEVPRASDREVATGLRALGDETRIQIMRLISDEPRSRKELAQLLSLSESAVSRHLKTLDAAGVVDTERDGYYVLYALQPERIGALGASLRQTLGIAPPAVPAPRRPAAPSTPVRDVRIGLRGDTRTTRTRFSIQADPPSTRHTVPRASDITTADPFSRQQDGLALHTTRTRTVPARAYPGPRPSHSPFTVGRTSRPQTTHVLVAQFRRPARSRVTGSNSATSPRTF